MIQRQLSVMQCLETEQDNLARCAPVIIFTCSEHHLNSISIYTESKKTIDIFR